MITVLTHKHPDQVATLRRNGLDDDKIELLYWVVTEHDKRQHYFRHELEFVELEERNGIIRGSARQGRTTDERFQGRRYAEADMPFVTDVRYEQGANGMREVWDVAVSPWQERWFSDAQLSSDMGYYDDASDEGVEYEFELDTEEVYA